MGNVTFHKRSLEMIPPEIIREIFEWIPRETIALISHEHYLRSLERLPKVTSWKVMHIMLGKCSPRHHRYFHEELCKHLVRHFGISNVLHSICPLAINEKYKIPMLRRYILTVLEYNKSLDFPQKVITTMNCTTIAPDIFKKLRDQ